MPYTSRSKNLSLLCHLWGRQEDIAGVLKPLTNAAYISEMIRGQREISDRDARKIEALLKIEDGWMDRDNLQVIKMPDIDYKLFMAVSSISLNKGVALLSLLSEWSKSEA